MPHDAHVARAHLVLEEGYRFTITFPDFADAAPLVSDEPAPLGEAGGPNPAALLASAVGNCLASSLLFCLRKSRAGAAAVAADAIAHIERNEAGRFRITGVDVRLDVDLPEEDRARLARCRPLFEDFCLVTESVRQGIPVRVDLAVRDSEGVA